MLSEMLSIANTLSKNVQLAISLSGKAAAVSVCFLGGAATTCYIAHEVVEYKKTCNNAPERDCYTQQKHPTECADTQKSVTECQQPMTIFDDL